MSTGAKTKISLISVEEYISHFEAALKDGLDILHVTLSTGLTGTYNSACIAKGELQEKYPDRKIYILWIPSALPADTG